ncbi:MAG: Mobile element protein, partial [uncultured Acetobacteraceae bacterium]
APRCPPRPARGFRLGRRHHLVLGPAVLPLGPAGRRRRQGQRPLRPGPRPRLLHPRLRPAWPLQRAGLVGDRPRSPVRARRPAAPRHGAPYRHAFYPPARSRRSGTGCGLRHAMQAAAAV